MTQITHDKLAFEDASDEQLREFATDYLQLELGKDVKSRAQVLAQIDKAWKNPFILVQQHVQPIIVDQTDKPKQATQFIGFLTKYRDDPIVELEIGQTGYPGGDKPVPINVNGGNIVIPRGRPFGIPYRFYLALMNSHSIDVTQDKDTLELQFTRVTNYPLTVHSLPSKEEIAAWHKATDSIPLGGHAPAKKKAA